MLRGASRPKSRRLFLTRLFVTLLAAVYPLSGALAQVYISPGQNIQSLVSANPTGTTFILRSGIHRYQGSIGSSTLHIAPKDGNTFIGENGAVLRGSVDVDPASFKADGGRYSASWTMELSTGNAEGEGSYTGCQYREDLYVDDQPLWQVESLSQLDQNGEWYHDRNGNKIYMNYNPTGKDLEMTMVSSAFGSNAKNVTLRNLVIEKYSCDAQKAAVMSCVPGSETNAGANWLVEDCVIRHNHGVGLKFFGPNNIIRRSKVYTNGQMGLASYRADKMLVEDCDVYNNNVAGFSDGWEAGGSKFVRSTNSTVKNCRFYNNIGPGIWFDIDNRYNIIENNTVYGNHDTGIFYEISYAATIRNNIVYYNGQQPDTWAGPGGILISASPDCEVYGNRVWGNCRNISLQQQNRGTGAYGEYIITNAKIHDNLIGFESFRSTATGDSVLARTQYSGGWDDTGGNLFSASRNNKFYNNTYENPSTVRGTNMWAWSNSTRSWSAWQGYGQDQTGKLVTTEISFPNGTTPPPTGGGGTTPPDTTTAPPPPPATTLVAKPAINSFKVNGQSVAVANGALSLVRPADGKLTIELEADNQGDDAYPDHNGITIGFAQLTAATDKALVQFVPSTTDEALETGIFFGADNPAGDGNAEYVWFEAKDPTAWDGADGGVSEKHQLKLVVTSKAAGTFDIYVRMAMNCVQTWSEGLVRLPATSSYTDAIGLPAYRIRVTLTNPTTPPPVTPSTAVSLTNVSTAPGSTFTVSVNLSNQDSISGGQFTVSSSPAGLLTLKSAAATARTPGWNVSASDGQSLVFYCPLGTKIAPGTGEIIKLSFEVSAGATVGSQATLALASMQLANAAQQPVTATLSGGTVTIGGCTIAGDINGDKVVNIIDVLMLVDFALGRKTPSASQLACVDFDRNNKADIFDVLACLDRVLGRSGTALAAAGEGLPAWSEVESRLSGLGMEQQLLGELQALFQQQTAAVSLPKAFALDQNSPNPFNPSTTINYSVPEGYSGTVSLAVYDLRGRLVKQLAEGTRPAGSYRAFWDGTDASGQQLASGIYFYRLIAGEHVQTRKMVLLK